MKLRVGLVGLGDVWGSRYLPALRGLSDRYEVRGVFCDVAQKAEQVCREFSATAADGVRALAYREDIDALLILSPQWHGHLPILAACAAGKAVFCAAPLDMEPQQARDIQQRVDASGIAFMVELAHRQAPATLRLKELIATRLGQPRFLFCHQRKPLATANGGRSSLRTMMELVDWCCYVAGAEPTSVTSAAFSHEEYKMLSLDFSPESNRSQGPLAQISSGHYISANWPEANAFRPPAALQVACEKGIAFIDLPSTIIWFDEAGRHMETLDSDRPVGEQLLTQFHRAVTSLVRKTADMQDAYRALNVALAAKQSYEEGRRIPLS